MSSTTVKLHYATRQGRKRYLLRWYSPDGHRRGEVLPIGITKRDAIQAQRSKQCNIDRDDTGLVADPPDRLTLVNFLNQMINSADVHFRTKRNMGQSRDKLTALLGPDTPVSRVALPQAERFRDSMFAANLKRSTVTKHVNYLKGLWTRGQKVRLVPDNPFRALELRPVVQDNTIATYTRAEVEALIDSASHLYPKRAMWWSAFILTAYTTGMRCSELEHLRWSDINLRDATWSVRPRSTGTHNGYKVFAWEPKSRKSRGPFALPDRTVAALSALKVSSEPTPYVFLFPVDLTRTEAHITKYGNLPDRCVGSTGKNFARICKQVADLLGEWQSGRTFHTLRKTFASDMAEHVMPPVLQDLCGHADIKTTMAYYVTLSRRSTGDKIRQCFDGPSSPKLASTA